MLRPESPEPDPEPLTRGGLAHAALRDTLQGLRERTGSARVTQAGLGLARELLGEALARHEHEFPLSARAERVPGARRRLEADLERYLAHAAAQDSPLEPRWLELGFGFDDDHDDEEGGGLPALDLGDGVMLRGRIDRIDVTPGGDAVVYDYKGARVTPGARWIEDGKVQLALYMRAAERLLGVRVVGGLYQPLGGGDLRARGVLDAAAAVGVGVGVECVRTDLMDAAEIDALVREAVALARAAAAQAVAGEIEARPWTCAFTGGCSHPAICRSGR